MRTRAEHRLYMRCWRDRKRHWPGWDFDGMCAMVGFSSPPSCLDPAIWNRVEPLYVEGCTVLFPVKAKASRQSKRLPWWQYSPSPSFPTAPSARSAA
jgi:hypothetical protein